MLCQAGRQYQSARGACSPSDRGFLGRVWRKILSRFTSPAFSSNERVTHRKTYCGLDLDSDFPQRSERCHANYAANIRGAMYHVMSRGDRREDIFLDGVDRQDFLKTLAEACQKIDWQVHAYCLRRNHYHLVLETPNANLVSGMAWLQSTYTIRLNHRHEFFGHVRSGRYSPAQRPVTAGSAGTGVRLGRPKYVT